MCPIIQPEPPRAKQIHKNRPCSHREQETGGWTQWNEYHDARSHKSGKMKRMFDLKKNAAQPKPLKKKEEIINNYYKCC